MISLAGRVTDISSADWDSLDGTNYPPFYESVLRIYWEI